MSTEGGAKAVVAAMFANGGIAITKFLAFLATGSSSMLSEAVHSVADTCNQGLLLIGGKRSKRAADDTHQFGYGRTRYVYAFIVAIIIFLLGGVFSPFGVTMAEVTGDPRWDGVGAMAVGCLLVIIAVFLAFEMSSMLIGESALPEEEARIRTTLAATPGVESIIHMRTLHTGPDQLLVGAKIAFPPAITAEQVADTIDDAEARIRAEMPTSKWIYLEPDIRRDE